MVTVALAPAAITCTMPSDAVKYITVASALVEVPHIVTLDPVGPVAGAFICITLPRVVDVVVLLRVVVDV